MFFFHERRALPPYFRNPCNEDGTLDFLPNCYCFSCTCIHSCHRDLCCWAIGSCRWQESCHRPLLLSPHENALVFWPKRLHVWVETPSRFFKTPWCFLAAIDRWKENVLLPPIVTWYSRSVAGVAGILGEMKFAGIGSLFYPFSIGLCFLSVFFFLFTVAHFCKSFTMVRSMTSL